MTVAGKSKVEIHAEETKGVMDVTAEDAKEMRGLLMVRVYR